MAGTDNFTIHTRELGPMENFVYLLHDNSSDTAAIVDPAWDVEEMLELADSKGICITDILLTHSHHDHVNGIEAVLNHSDAQIHLLKAEADFWGKTLARPRLHHGGDHIQVGETAIEILHTPGHTPGSACLLGDGVALTGDTLSADRALQMGVVQQLLPEDEWGKVDTTFEQMVFAEATLVVPLLVSDAWHRGC